MKLKIVGSGGMSIISSSFCKCKICQEARQKGGRYERLGPSLYIDDIKMLIDTPEEIAVACNRQNITEVKHLSISHSDPDHVKGMRIVENQRLVSPYWRTDEVVINNDLYLLQR